MGAAPRNLDYYLQRMSGYSKNTIRIHPQSKDQYNAGDTLIFRLPTNSILDLHTFTMRFAAQIQSLVAQGGANVLVAYPRFTSSFIRRCDWTMGGMQVGLGSLHDYGFLNHWLESHRVPHTRTNGDLLVTDQGGYLSNVPLNNQAGSESTISLTPGQLGDWKPMSISNWLGIAGGQFMVSRNVS